MPEPTADSSGINVKAFERIDEAGSVQDYIRILDIFDGLAGIQRLKQVAIEQCRLKPGMSVLDVGCGTGLETVRLAKVVAPSGTVVGIDASEKFLVEARRRTAGLGLPIDYRQGDALQIQFPEKTFDVARAERLFPYLAAPERALSELIRVTKRGGVVALIEPDFETVMINVSNRTLVRKVLHFDCDHHTKHGWIGRDLPRLFKAAGLVDIAIEADVVIFEPTSFSAYFLEIGRAAHQEQVISALELDQWRQDITRLLSRDELFCTISYFLAVGRVPDRLSS
ncbi:methyltransferase domain-containing protein [Nitrospira sp. Nam80]